LASSEKSSKDTVLEVRYVGNASHRGWRRIDYNEVNIFENGFLQEFKNAQNNLAINAANGFPNNFQFKGLPGQVPLPIFDAAFWARDRAVPTAMRSWATTPATPSLPRCSKAKRARRQIRWPQIATSSAECSEAPLPPA